MSAAIGQSRPGEGVETAGGTTGSGSIRISSTLSNWLVGALACLLMVGLTAWTGERPHSAGTPAAVGEVKRIYNSTVQVLDFRIGQVLYVNERFKRRTGAVFLAVRVAAATDGVGQPTVSWDISGSRGNSTFAPLEKSRVPAAGFRQTYDVVFEVGPQDLDGFKVHFLDRALLYSYDAEIVVDLGITPERAAQLVEADRYATVQASDGTPEVIP